jgi:omega-6 fatty acid desaturase (delta-12 desaturase)
MDSPSSKTRAPGWFAATKAFESPSRLAASLQLADTLGPFVLVAVLAAVAGRLTLPWYLLWPFPVVGGLFLVRLFILFHDCCHGSFWPSRQANRVWGSILGVLTFTPFLAWRKSHGTHHAHNGNLDHRGTGDVWTMTLAEYRAASPGRRRLYRFYRHPLFLFGVAPPLLFLLVHRIPDPGASKAEVVSNLATTAAALALAGAVGGVAGWWFLLWYGLPTVWIGTALGVWLFYVQHQFDPGYWEHEEGWDPFAASLRGSSFYRLPRVAQWFSGNIGFHHLHHLRPRIPNYRLEACVRAVPELQLPQPLTVRASLRGLGLHVWDEASRRLLTFRQAAGTPGA